MIEVDSSCDDLWSQLGLAPSNDIWNKFEWGMPTPPHSPLREVDLDPFDSCHNSLDEDTILEEDLLHLSMSVDLIWPGDLPSTCPHGVVEETCNSCSRLALAGSELRHDCMWSGSCPNEAHLRRSSCSHYHDYIPQETTNAYLMEDDDEDDAAYSRPDTPSESSDTDDADEGVVGGTWRHEEVTMGVHTDHCYHTLSPPPKWAATRGQQQEVQTTQLSPNSVMLHTPPYYSDDANDVDVENVGSPASSHSTGSGWSTVSSGYTSWSSSSSSTSSYRAMSTASMPLGLRIRRVRIPTTKRVTKKQLNRTHKLTVTGNVRVTVPSRLHQQETLRDSSRRVRSNGHCKQTRKEKKKQLFDPAQTEPRNFHNKLERQRRIDLRIAFENLRLVVPLLSTKERTPKIEILNKTASYCTVLDREEQVLLREKAKLEKYNESMQWQLRQLRHSN